MWFKVDDGCAEHPKMREATMAVEIANPGRGAHVLALWASAGNRCAKANGEGVVSVVMLDDAAHNCRADAALVTPALIAAGLWHDAKTIRKCSRCAEALRDSHAKKLGPGEIYFHDWLVYQFTKEEVTNEDHNRRARALRKNRGLCDAIKDRDRNHCRYCAAKVAFRGDRRSALAGTYDHVDPHGRNSLDNVVVACKKCNETKGDRTPEEAGMPLLPVPARYPSPPWPLDLAPDQAPGASSELVPNQLGASSSSSLSYVGDGARSELAPELGSEPGPGSAGSVSTESGLDHDHLHNGAVA
jgi:5-methylcytosine-specific restriction endonuclease McrA